jgi:uncharacterized protein (DUF433 family)
MREAMDATTPDQHLERITITPGVRSGQPIIRGTRTTVADILSWLAAGVPEQEILSDYPWLRSEDIKAALAYAAQELRHPQAR